MFNDPNGDDARVTVQKDPNGTGKIQIAAIVYVTGNGATQAQVDYANKAAAKLPTGTYEHKLSDGTTEKYDVSYKVEFKFENKEQADLQPGENILQVVNGSSARFSTSAGEIKNDDGTTTSYAPNFGSGGSETTSGGTRSDAEMGKTLLHESFHELGLSDRYSDNADRTKSTTHKGYEKDIMGGGANYPNPQISQNHTNNFGDKFSGKAPGTYTSDKMVDKDDHGNLVPPSAPQK